MNERLVDEFTVGVLSDCLETAAAWDLLHSEAGGNLTMDGMYEQMIAAGYDEETAQRAATRRGMERLRNEMSP